MNISVAIATYNGEKYIKQQLKSILCQLNDLDEIIISDDGSNDQTIEIIKSLDDKKIKIYKNKKKGVISNFENAIKKCNNEIIFLADQDDIWAENKVKLMKNQFKNDKNLKLVQSNFYITDENLKITGEGALKKRGIIRNIIKNNYMGSAFAFQKEIAGLILPIPENVPMHDIWIGSIASLSGDVVFLEDKLFYYRRHSNAVTINSGSISKRIIWRFHISKEIFKYFTKWRRL